jgi:hypothetical protein
MLKQEEKIVVKNAVIENDENEGLNALLGKNVTL